MAISNPPARKDQAKDEVHVVVVVYHVTIVAMDNGLGLLKKCWPFGNRLRSTHCGSSFM